MKIEVHQEFPPNIADIDAKFDVKGIPGIVYAYAPGIYNPSGGTIPLQIVQHEMVHLQRQGSDPAAWWKKYIDDVEFRVDEEVIAHKMEYKVFCTMYKDRNAQARYLDHVARKLSNRMYGGMLNYIEARRKVTL